MLPSTTLKPGDTNKAEVQKLQDYLVSQGLLTEAQKATGYGIYGPATTAAVSALQKKLGVDTSQGGVGYFGPQTFAATTKTIQAPASNSNTLYLPNGGASALPGLTQMGAPAPIKPVTTPVNVSNIPTVEELIKTYQFGNGNGSYDANGGSMNTNTGSTNPNVLSISQTPLKPVDITATTPNPIRNNQYDPVQSNTIPTPAYGGAKIDPKVIADTINIANGNPTSYTAPDSRGVLSQLIADRAMNRGLYAVEPGLQLSPEQINARRNAADHFYASQVQDLIDKEKASVSSGLGDLNARQSSVVQQINTSLDSSPIVKQYVELQSQYNNMLNSVGKGSGANDIATIYTFMKSLDPDSVVRETEYETGAQKSGNIFAGYMAKFNGLINPNGGFVSEQAKKNILQTINDRFAVKGQQYKNLRDQKVKQLEMRGVPNANDFVTQYDFTFDTTGGTGQQNNSQDTSGVNPAWNW